MGIFLQNAEYDKGVEERRLWCWPTLVKFVNLIDVLYRMLYNVNCHGLVSAKTLICSEQHSSQPEARYSASPGCEVALLRIDHTISPPRIHPAPTVTRRHLCILYLVSHRSVPDRMLHQIGYKDGRIQGDWHPSRYRKTWMGCLYVHFRHSIINLFIIFCIFSSKY